MSKQKNICLDCKNYVESIAGVHDICTRNLKFDFVKGVYVRLSTSCYTEREFEGGNYCGQDGKFWEHK